MIVVTPNKTAILVNVQAVEKDVSLDISAPRPVVVQSNFSGASVEPIVQPVSITPSFDVSVVAPSVQPVTVRPSMVVATGPKAPAAWIDYVGWPSTALGTVEGGAVRSYTRGVDVVYRFIPDPYDAAQDAFYSHFDGGALSGLIAARGTAA